jgi:hypothetical protein
MGFQQFLLRGIEPRASACYPLEMLLISMIAALLSTDAVAYDRAQFVRAPSSFPSPGIRFGVAMTEAEWKQACTDRSLAFGYEKLTDGTPATLPDGRPGGFECLRPGRAERSLEQELADVAVWAPSQWRLTGLASDASQERMVLQAVFVQSFQVLSPDALARMFVEKHGSVGLQPCPSSIPSKNCRDGTRFGSEWEDGAVDVTVNYELLIDDVPVLVRVSFYQDGARVLGWISFNDHSFRYLAAAKERAQKSL